MQDPSRPYRDHTDARLHQDLSEFQENLLWASQEVDDIEKSWPNSYTRHDDYESYVNRRDAIQSEIDDIRDEQRYRRADG